MDAKFRQLQQQFYANSHDEMAAVAYVRAAARAGYPVEITHFDTLHPAVNELLPTTSVQIHGREIDQLMVCVFGNMIIHDDGPDADMRFHGLYYHPKYKTVYVGYQLWTDPQITTTVRYVTRTEPNSEQTTTFRESEIEGHYGLHDALSERTGFVIPDLRILGTEEDVIPGYGLHINHRSFEYYAADYIGPERWTITRRYAIPAKEIAGAYLIYDFNQDGFNWESVSCRDHNYSQAHNKFYEGSISSDYGTQVYVPREISTDLILDDYWQRRATPQEMAQWRQYWLSVLEDRPPPHFRVFLHTTKQEDKYVIDDDPNYHWEGAPQLTPNYAQAVALLQALNSTGIHTIHAYVPVPHYNMLRPLPPL